MRSLVVPAGIAGVLFCSSAWAQNQDSGTGGSSGVSFGGGGLNGGLSITAGQGFSRSMSTNAPTLTLMNGVPGSVFGGVVQPFVTALVPIAGAPPATLPAYQPTAMSAVRRMLDRGEIQLRKDASGKTRLVINEPPRRRAAAQPQPPRTTSASSDQFRRAMEKYAGAKR